ncbi:MAG: elongation factor P, partial [Chloroflexi bacterium]|nr:elongation factor P [Chloroflexota bacterium]
MNIEDIRKNSKIMFDNIPYNVDDAEFMKPGKGSGIYRLKLRNLRDGSTINRTYHSGDKVDEISLTTKNEQFLYQEGDQYVFMDTETYEQNTIPEQLLGDKRHFLKEGTLVTILMMGDEPLDVALPNFVELKVVSSDITSRAETIT